MWHVRLGFPLFALVIAAFGPEVQNADCRYRFPCQAVSNRFLQNRRREYIVVHEKVEEGCNGGHFGFHCRDVHAPVLLMLYESFKIRALEFPNVVFARYPIKLEEKHDRGEGTVDRFWAMV